MTTTTPRIDALKASYRSAEAKASAKTSFDHNGRVVGHSPQQEAAVTRIFAKMKRAYVEAGFSEQEMLNDLNNR